MEKLGIKSVLCIFKFGVTFCCFNYWSLPDMLKTRVYFYAKGEVKSHLVSLKIVIKPRASKPQG